jgi:Planctomycete cytochrome C
MNIDGIPIARPLSAQGGTMKSSRIEMLLSAIALGAVLSGCGSETSGIPGNGEQVASALHSMATTGTDTYSYLSVSLFKQYCTSCHSGAKPPKGIDLSSYATIISSGAVVANNPTTSLAYQEILAGKMPPKNGPVPTDLQQDLLDWINSGAPNN